jgi:primosomal protein N' (replication factor Y) (superfamily II helicase)
MVHEASAPRYAEVAVPVPLGQAFTYSVPEALATGVVRGARVLVEFGTRRVMGVVLETTHSPPDLPPDKVKPVQAVVDTEPVLPEELLSFLVELGRYYLAPIGEVMRLALPAVERASAERLANEGLLDRATTETAGRIVEIACVAEEAPAGAKAPRGLAQKVLDHLREAGPTPVPVLEEQHGKVRAALRRLRALGLVRMERQAAPADPFQQGDVVRDTPPTLNAAQRYAVEAIMGRFDRADRGAFLLHGVTASGKTEVYLHAVERCLALGGGAVVLVPEIALTPQLVQRFRARLGDVIAVLHSGLTGRERHAMWTALRSGRLRVAVGARSALFAPVEGLRLLCVDEEHDPSFKQEDGVRYNARDMAMLRAHRAGAVCVLGSATPSLASERLSRTSRLERLALPDRAHRAAALPEVEVVDLRRTGPGPGGERLLSLPLFRHLERTLGQREQAILFLNRRGFAPSLVCDACGAVAECPNCSVALTVHRARGERLVCHYCDYTAVDAAACPACRSTRVVLEGAGTERIEHVLSEAFPQATVARLDRDVAAGLASERVLARMRSGEIDILVGTQMVTKGHDLPNVTLVGVLNADAALSMPDYHASERAFQLIVQVAGRAGRAEAPGRVVIQTRNPDHPAVRLAVAHDVLGFVEAELAAREELRYPPFSRIALVRLDAIDARRAEAATERLAAVARRAAPRGVDVLGPSPAPIAKVRNRHRFRFMVRGPSRRELHPCLIAVARAPLERVVRMSIDVDPMNML